MNNQTDSNNTTKKRRGPGDGPVLKSGGRDARKTAALVLEVLSGELNPAEAAEILQVGLPCYYQIEKRAFEGLIQACEKDGRKGRQKSEAVRIRELEQELAMQQREVRRAQALLRAAQKVGGIATAVAEVRNRKPENGRKRRKPMARALKAARSLRKEDEINTPEMPINGATALLQEGCDGAGTNDQRQRSGGQTGRIGQRTGTAQGHSGHSGRPQDDRGGLSGTRDLRSDVSQTARPFPAGRSGESGTEEMRAQADGNRA